MKILSCWVGFCLLISLHIKAQGISNSLSLFQFKEHRDSLIQQLPKNAFAVFFSASNFKESDCPENPDFFYLTGIRCSGGVLLLSEKEISWSGKKSNTFLFLPSGFDNQGSEIRALPNALESFSFVVDAREWKSFCMEQIIDNQSSVVYLRPENTDTNRLQCVSPSALLKENLFNHFKEPHPYDWAWKGYSIILKSTEGDFLKSQKQIKGLVTYYYAPGDENLILRSAMLAQSFAEWIPLKEKILRLKFNGQFLVPFLDFHEVLFQESEFDSLRKVSMQFVSGFNSAKNDSLFHWKENSKAIFQKYFGTENEAVVSELSIFVPGHKGFLEILDHSEPDATGTLQLDLAVNVYGIQFILSRVKTEKEKEVLQALTHFHLSQIERCKAGLSLSEILESPQAFTNTTGIKAGFYSGAAWLTGFREFASFPVFSGGKLANGMVLVLETGFALATFKGQKPSSMRLRDVILITNEGAECLSCEAKW